MAAAAPVAWVVDHGWHTEIGLPAEQVTGPLSYFHTVFPGAKVLMFGFGKRTFITAKVETLSELVMGPVPGPGAIQVTGLKVEPARAYNDLVVQVKLAPDGPGLLSNFIWSAIGRTQAGLPRLISAGLFPGSAFYAASHSYDLSYTCNTWTEEALQGAGLPVGTDAILASGALREIVQLGGACRALR